MEVYLDNAATTKCDAEVVRLMTTYYTEEYGNPSSAHRKGFAAEKGLREAYETIAKTLKVGAKEIVFTSGGTEADNLALLGAAHALKRKGKRIVTTQIEHPAVSETAKRLQEEGFDVALLPTDNEGVVDLRALEDALTDDTILVSVMAVNNEIGAVQPLKEIGAIVKARCKDALFHTDAVQGYGKIPIDVKDSQIDLLSVSAHKLHGPKGAGFLYVKKGARLTPQTLGGGQQEGLRSGTENVPANVGCALAAKKAFDAMDEVGARLYDLRRSFCDALEKRVADVRINGARGNDPVRIAPHIVSFSVRGVRAEVLLHALEDEEIYVSGGSACASHHANISKTLEAIGLEPEWAQGTIRVSMSDLTTKEELEKTITALEALVPKLRKYQPR